MVKKAAQARPNHLLRQARLERGWTHKEVADHIGAPLDLMITRWERGTTRPSAFYARKLCQLFDKSASELGLVAGAPEAAQSTLPEPPAVPEREPGADHVWNVPFRRNPCFTGRTDLLERLHAQSDQTDHRARTHVQALIGLGGIGKTQIAVEYAYRHRHEYRAVLWVRAASQEMLTADLVALAHLLRLPERTDQDQARVVAAVRRWLAEEPGWLLILDNADDLGLLKNVLPATEAGQVLLTTRDQAIGTLAEPLLVEKLDQVEGTLLLLRRARLLAPDAPLDNASRVLYTQARAIVQAVDGLPLALDQAGAYLEETGCNLADYLTLYQRHWRHLLSRAGAESHDYPETVASTWALSFEQVEQANPAAADLLRLCAFLQPDAIAEEIITEGAVELGPTLSPVAGDLLALNEALRVLRRYSLVRRDGESKMLSLHRLVQAVLKDNLEAATMRQWAERAVRAVNAAFPEVQGGTLEPCARLMPQAQACATLIEEEGLAFPDAARLLDQTGRYLIQRSQLAQAETILRLALRLSEQVLGERHLQTANVLHDLAEAIYHLSRDMEAEPFFLQALAVREDLLGARHPDVAESLMYLGQLLHFQGKYPQAETLYLRALAIWEDPAGSGRLDVNEGLAFTLNNLALLYHHMGRYDQAEPLHQRALSIREQTLGVEHPDTAESLNNLAFLYGAQGKSEEEELLLRRAIRILEQTLGPDHPVTAMSLGNLAQVLTFQERYEEAEPLHLRALRIREQEQGPEHPDASYSLNNLALFYQRQGKYEQAEPLHQRALRIRERALGPDHPRVAQSLSNLARLYQAQGQRERAEQLFARALAVFEQALGSEHPDTATVREEYARLVQARRGLEKTMPQEGGQ